MKYYLGGFLILLATHVHAGEPIRCSSHQAACVPQHIQVDLFGKKMAPKQADYDAVRNVIGSLVADMKIEKFLLKGLGIEGGFSVCLEPADLNAYDMVMERLAGVTIDPKETIFEIKPIDSCE